FGRYQNLRGRRLATKRAKQKRSQGEADLRQFEEGDLVVHQEYGIGRFLEIGEKDGREVLVLEYADRAKLYVPTELGHLLSRYVGTGRGRPELTKLGGNRWNRTREKAEESIMDYAEQLLAIQAERTLTKDYVHEEDSKWQWEFENSFLYRETPDQLQAIEESKQDMVSTQPMDRLICGDVGFGKTEVAIRAAFKSVMSGRQVAFLVPTTVLAQQHYQNLRERMSDYPIKIDLLSRYRSPAQQRETIKNILNGEVDIVVGTHRLISKDIEFQKLGLVIIDEEQRFGVRHKERFKELFRMIDVLTLSATPIPRTLYLALLGVRDMSTIDTPPPNRIPVATAIVPYDEAIIQQSVERELKRQGQVFFLHNRVQTIGKVKETIERLCPGAKVEYGHGQMEEGELEDVMNRFIRHEFDVLVATTIIESGIDIPNANTIIIDRADRFGLADLYQLRGRVGRATEKAYAILMIPEDLLTAGDARKRINAIKQYTALGSGFKIAMRDLEIRGAGNLLGTQQSGHIAAVGFDLYCRLLKRSVSKLKGEATTRTMDVVLDLDFLCLSEAEYTLTPDGRLPAFLPHQYVPDAKARISGYRELAEVGTVKELRRTQSHWEDRFGRKPEAVVNLLVCAEIKCRAAQKNVSAVEVRGDKLIIIRRGKGMQLDGRYPRLEEVEAGDRLLEVREWIKKL
ncbi:MAG: transcription-repair coupling factor, partial [Verrucomicrobiota bacterium]